MSVADLLAAFHWLRPLWLLLLPLIAALWWIGRFHTAARETRARHVAPHLARALMVGQGKRGRLMPVDTLAALALCLVVGLAGPAWSRMPNPMVSQTAPLVIALEVTPSTLANDVPPSRLERAVLKIESLLATRSGAETALIAYSGSAHLVVPLTGDPALIKPYLEGLSPAVMPVEGDVAGQALALAETLLADQPVPGTILFLSDGVSGANLSAFTARDDANTLAFLSLLPGEAPLPEIEGLGARQVSVSADDSDIQTLERLLASAYRQALIDDDRLAWEDRGVWLAWPAALLALLGFRRGWQLGAVALTLGAGLWTGALGPGSLGIDVARAQSSVSTRAAEAESASPLTTRLMDAFLTPDQQGRWWVERNRYDRASMHFEDPAWRGYALYRDGQYAEAVTALAALETADAAFTQGLALIRSRQYRDAVAAFETALARDPDYPEGERNLALAREIRDYVEETREQSDTGEDRGEGADDIVFDNESQRGVETTLSGDEGDKLLTPEQWISAIDSETGDYLRQRFALEAAMSRSGGSADQAAEPASGPISGGVP
ncbi:VWA domain-containing protein [Salinicola avicenniae]|uniref:VWA domain-containing protein n=1 Tax=Salinicola avicenniae TaxID=2916836 RepID=UPI0020730CF1|nr:MULTISPECIES: VWA domain-containing protein [unclassified Salinicola]